MDPALSQPQDLNSSVPSQRQSAPKVRQGRSFSLQLTQGCYRFHYRRNSHDRHRVVRQILPSGGQPFVHQSSRERVKTCNIYSMKTKTKMRTVTPRSKRQHHSTWMAQRSGISLNHGGRGITMRLQSSRYDGWLFDGYVLMSP